MPFASKIRIAEPADKKLSDKQKDQKQQADDGRRTNHPYNRRPEVRRRVE
jgi:hypothetical protein